MLYISRRTARRVSPDEPSPATRRIDGTGRT